MSVIVSSFYEVVTRLPDGAVLRLDEVAWEDYEQLLAELGEGYAERIFYDDGRMEIMAPAFTHERAKNVVHDLVTTLRDALDVEVMSFGSTTLKRALRAKGAEPDDSFYIQNAARMIGKEDFDLQHDPPPDLVLEVDCTSSSIDKFAIYAALGVPEIWRLVKREVRIYWLTGDRYEASPTSRSFSFLPAQTLSTLLAQGLDQGERQATRALREWLREQS